MNTMLIHCLFLGLALALSHSAPPNLDMMMADMGHDHSHDGHDHAHDGHDHAHDGHDHASQGHAHVHDGQDHVHGVTGHDHVHDGHVHHHADHEHVAQIDRCEAVEFDAIVPDASGVPLFFKGDFMWRGFHGPSELINGSYKELIEQHAELGKINAALSMIAEDSDKHVFFLLNDKVFSYHDQTLEAGNPKAFSEVFPGIPKHVDAAVECPKGECVRDTVIFFKGCEVFHYETQTKKVKSSHWTHMPNCTSALRWQNNYYCFHGNQFTKFHPVTGSVTGTYPKDARDYFMKCPNFGLLSNHTERERCSHVPLDAIASDGLERAVAFRGNYFLREDETHRDGWHASLVSEAFKEVQSDAEAVFSHARLLYIVKDNKVFAYKSGEQYQLVEGYPKTLQEELGMEGPLDATFVCGDYSILHVIKGQQMFDIELSVSPRAVVHEARLPFPKVDGAMCGPNGIRVFVGAEYFEYKTPKLLAYSRMRPQAHKITLEMFGCDH
uniref:Hemopexin-like n=1 Tax=Gadus morhua TaxID=8049 RepID=A0A8C5C128_GADMO